MNALHEQFVAEARELVDQATDDLIAIEREGFAAERVDRVFRAFHTLKGSAGVVELPEMVLSLHAAEDVLAAIHAGRLDATTPAIDRALACLDQVSVWVDEFEARGSLPSGAGWDARAMAARLRDLLSTGPGGQTARDGRDRATVANAAPPEWVSRLIESDRGQIFRRLPADADHLLAVSYEPRSECFFDGDDPLALMRQVPDLLAFHIEPRAAWSPPSDMDPFACNLRLQCLSAAGRADLAAIFRLVPDEVQIIDVPRHALRPRPGVRTDEAERAGLVRAVIDEQRRVLRMSARNDDVAGRIGAAARAAANALRHGARADLAGRVEHAAAEAGRRGDAGSLLPVLDATLAALAPGAPAADGSDSAVRDPAGAIMEDARGAATRTLRVDESKIDALLDLAAELMIVRNGFAHLTRRVAAEVGGHGLARAMRHEQETIERLIGDMHGAILQLRMVPVARVFQPFRRLLRDMAMRLDKKVELVTRGETTESDKTIVDRLFEPLLHLVRNAVDHGIESPEQRRAAGKPDEAVIRMEASRVGDRFVVEISDDGRGIDPAIVRRKAGERGVLAADALAALSDEQVVDLVFSAGFSTAAEISDISGRGVGMGAVRTTVEQIGGRVSLSSRIGAGTTVRLDLPTSIAMSRIMVVEAGGHLFGVPMEAVTETLRLAPDRISRIATNVGFVLRDRVVPICALAELMGLPVAPASDERIRLLVVIDTGGKSVALEVDGIRDRLEAVLKPMPGVLSGARGYVGTTLLGDGGILLVLDVKAILP